MQILLTSVQVRLARLLGLLPLFCSRPCVSVGTVGVILAFNRLLARRFECIIRNRSAVALCRDQPRIDLRSRDVDGGAMSSAAHILNGSRSWPWIMLMSASTVTFRGEAGDATLSPAHARRYRSYDMSSTIPGLPAI